jgi:hypothetical protein
MQSLSSEQAHFRGYMKAIPGVCLSAITGTASRSGRASMRHQAYGAGVAVVFASLAVVACEGGSPAGA